MDKNKTLQNRFLKNEVRTIITCSFRKKYGKSYIEIICLDSRGNLIIVNQNMVIFL